MQLATRFSEIGFPLDMPRPPLFDLGRRRVRNFFSGNRDTEPHRSALSLEAQAFQTRAVSARLRREAPGEAAIHGLRLGGPVLHAHSATLLAHRSRPMAVGGRRPSGNGGSESPPTEPRAVDSEHARVPLAPNLNLRSRPTVTLWQGT